MKYGRTQFSTNIHRGQNLRIDKSGHAMFVVVRLRSLLSHLKQHKWALIEQLGAFRTALHKDEVDWCP